MDQPPQEEEVGGRSKVNHMGDSNELKRVRPSLAVKGMGLYRN